MAVHPKQLELRSGMVGEKIVTKEIVKWKRAAFSLFIYASISYACIEDKRLQGVLTKCFQIVRNLCDS